MEFDPQHLLAILPELFVAVMACVVLVLDLYIRPEHRVITYTITLLALVGGMVLAIGQYPEHALVVFSGTFVHDAFGATVKVAMLGLATLMMLYGRRHLQRLDMFRGEFFILVLLAAVGMMLMASAASLLMAYLGLEMMSLSLYTMIAMDRDSESSTEGALKYFILGGMASGILLYGLSLLYGATGSLAVAEVARHSYAVGTGDPLLLLGLVFTLVGLAFKLGAVPFHMWIPDVYEGAPTPVVALLASAPKIAAFALLIRLVVEGLGGVTEQWQQVAVLLAVLSLIIGNVAAIAQNSIKRMLAYSAIAHVGYFFIGLAGGPAQGYMAPLLYMLMYGLMGVGAFGLVTLLHRADVGGDRIDDYKGLSRRHPWLAALMVILMFGMAGVPPTGGFMAKLFVFQAAVAAGYVYLAIFGVVMAVIGAFYYLRVVKVMYFDEPEAELVADRDGLAKLALSGNALAVLGLGILPAPLVSVCLHAVQGI
jgi:NADH-quinone oxidoreductase subunit N